MTPDKQPRHKIIYTYSYKLYSSSKFQNAPEPTEQPLSEPVNAEQLLSVLSPNKMENVYKIQLIRQKSVIDMRGNLQKVAKHTNFGTQDNHPIVAKSFKVLNLYVSDRPMTVKEVSHKNPQAFMQYINPILSNNNIGNNVNNPAVVTAYRTETRYGTTNGGYVCAKPVFQEWNEKIVDVYLLVDDKDILVNKKLQQIWPKDTGKLPRVLQDMLKEPNAR